MKPIKHLWLACFCILLTASQCKKDPLSQLPPETQTGANTFGCLVNGEAWTPKGSDGYSGLNKNAYYQHIYPSPVGYVFQLSATNYDSEPLQGVDFGADSIKIKSGIIYKFKNGNKGLFGASYNIGISNDMAFWVRDSLEGELFFTRFDEDNQIASGNFWFDAMNNAGQVVQVREGRFDMKFTR